MAVRSPCTNVCRIDRRSGWCEGCGRTVDEIMAWPRATEAEQAALVAQLPARLARRQPWLVKRWPFARTRS